MTVEVECYSCDWVGTIPVYDRWAICPDCHIAGHLHPAFPDPPPDSAEGDEDRAEPAPTPTVD